MQGRRTESAAGASADQRPRTSLPITGFWLEDAFTKRSV
jgi:hypothetical protein